MQARIAAASRSYVHSLNIAGRQSAYRTDTIGKKLTHPIKNADSGIYLRGTGKAQLNIWCWPIGSGEVYGIRNDEKQPAEIRAGVTPTSTACHGRGVDGRVMAAAR